MFSLFHNNKNTFPKETEEGNIYIKDNRLYFSDHGYEESVDLSKLKYAYVEILGEDPYLFLFDYIQHYIPVLQQGFSKAYPQISQQFDFNDELFFKTIHSKKEQKHRIWIKSNKRNYSILKESYDDYNQGFEVQSTPPLFVSWDSTYEEILNLNIGFLYPSDFETTYFKFNHPIRIGSLLIDELEFYYDASDRQNIAVQSYFTTLYDGSNTDSSYKELRELWMKTIPTDLEDAGYEREDQKNLSFDLEDIYFTIIYTYDVEDQYDDGGTSISISNYRDYSDEILTDRLDISTDTISVLSFIPLFQFQPNYKNNPNVIALPKAVETIEPYRNALWIADDQTFGFTSDRYAIRFHKNEVKSIIVQNVLPAKGGGYVELMVRQQDDQLVSIYYGEQHALDPYIDKMHELLQIEIEVPEPYYNC